MPMENLRDAFIHELEDILHAEKQLSKALPRFTKAATDEKLRDGFQKHADETKNQISRLERIFQMLNVKPKNRKCDGMAGLIEEAATIMGEDADPEVMDALLVEAAQKIEHYEIATYGTLCTWAEELGYQDVVDVLKETLREEKDEDRKLTEASRDLNIRAAQPAGA
ncbi:MAG: ferritin-like domain-containing protein [Phycisphaerae bacterium]|jgi:ferritin-like metal-binding protein YciE|nr:ferritin-like domain-containing protein [Phycisphaerae bacterium]HOO17609.1 ferritin-like domain-containing protein [Phycisphaerae bacterium]HPC21226.1 ferritin-like domain-containing protein [Phycisphaerae bacterium]HRS27316.1 ferritin-like domain-containing protein [Phycisphaerae bacterium]HRT41410.1 ferritin-like domain-containing protein [Phycisphaerae bacterium]